MTPQITDILVYQIFINRFNVFVKNLHHFIISLAYIRGFRFKLRKHSIIPKDNRKQKLSLNVTSIKHHRFADYSHFERNFWVDLFDFFPLFAFSFQKKKKKTISTRTKRTENWMRIRIREINAQNSELSYLVEQIVSLYFSTRLNEWINPIHESLRKKVNWNLCQQLENNLVWIHKSFVLEFVRFFFVSFHF